MDDDFLELQKLFIKMNRDEQLEFLKKLNAEEVMFFYEHPNIFLFEKQIIPNGKWRYCLLRCGRRFGKSMSGSAWMANRVIEGAKVLALCGEDYSTVYSVMVKNVMSWFPNGICRYIKQDHKIVFDKKSKYEGTEIYCYTSDKEIKGPSLEYLWADELGNWCDRNPEKTKIRFDSLDTAVSVGEHPQTIITTTPRSFPFFFEYQEHIDNNDPNYAIMMGNMFDNPYLTEGYRQKELDKYKYNPVLLRQEIYGDLVFENPTALFQREWIEKNRIFDPENAKREHDIDLKYFYNKFGKEIIIKRCVICVDPSGSSKKTSDETGIIICLQAMNNEVYVIYDKSGVHTPDTWARIVKDMFWFFHNKNLQTNIVVETNFGGDLVIANLLAADHKLRPFIKEIKASKSKSLRAETSASKYQRGKIHHVGWYDKLERQMVNYIGTKDASLTGSKSPDRMDALVHAINELVVVPQYIQRDVAILNGF